MKQPFTILFLALITVMFSSCFKEDDPVAPHPRGDVFTDTIPMTYNYRYQVYYRLDSAAQVMVIPKTTADLGFECAGQGWKVILNTANFMKAADLGEVPFGMPLDTAGKHWKFDKSDGNPDSLAIGRWFIQEEDDTVSLNHVYLIDRGLDESGNALGFYQFRIDSLKGGVYYFRIAQLDGSGLSTASVRKDASLNYQWFSLATETPVSAEPPAGDYDLLFTQYTTLLYTDLGEAYPYLVTGVLLNRSNTMACRDTLHNFATITIGEASAMHYSGATDVIGYDWKYYNFETGSYTVETNRFYLVRDRKNFIWKLRFIGFYNRMGEKGYPVIEFQRL